MICYLFPDIFHSGDISHDIIGVVCRSTKSPKFCTMVLCVSDCYCTENLQNVGWHSPSCLVNTTLLSFQVNHSALSKLSNSRLNVFCCDEVNIVRITESLERRLLASDGHLREILQTPNIMNNFNLYFPLRSHSNICSRLNSANFCHRKYKKFPNTDFV